MKQWHYLKALKVIKTGYDLEPLMPETMKLLGSTKSKITVNKNGENIPHLLLTELVLVHCHFVNNDYQQDSRVLYTFVPNKSFGELLDISPKNLMFLKAFDSELSYIEVWFINQNPKPLEIYKINIALVINQKVKYKKSYAVQFNLEIWLVIKLLIGLQKLQKLHNKII